MKSKLLLFTLMLILSLVSVCALAKEEPGEEPQAVSQEPSETQPQPSETQPQPSETQPQPAETQLEQAPDFTLEGLKAEKFILSEILKDKMVLLDFWASWCPHCTEMIPDLKKFYKEHQEQVEVIGINVGEVSDKVKQFVQKKKIPYAIALDPFAQVAKSYKVAGIPTLVAVGKDGKILYYGHSLEEMQGKVDFK